MTFANLKLIAITDVEQFGAERTMEQARKLAARAKPGSLGIQLREHQLEARLRLTLGRELRATTAQYGQLLIVNDRLDLACLLGADGLHLGEASVTTEDARGFFAANLVSFSHAGSHPWISRSLHDPVSPELHSDLSRWERGSATKKFALDPTPNAWLVSPVLKARKGREALGLEAVRLVRNQLDGWNGVRPQLFALGGVGAGDVQALLLAGADGVAAISQVWGPSTGDAVSLLAELDMLA